jgi:sugar-specific transcriptional regulator TrmB
MVFTSALHMFTAHLQQLGLTKNEAKIYEALLQLGQCGVAAISQTARVNRRNVYDALKSLQEKKLVNEDYSAARKEYGAVDPTYLEALLQEHKSLVKEIVPALEAVTAKRDAKQQAFISHGIEGIKDYMQYVIAHKHPAYFIAGKGLWHDPRLEDARERYFNTAARKKIPIQGIFDYEMLEVGKDVYTKYPESDFRFFDQGYSTPATVDICGDRVSYTTMRTHNVVAEYNVIFNIVSKPLADAYKTWFMALWEQAKQLSYFENK